MAYGTKAEMHEEIMRRKQAERERYYRNRQANMDLKVAPRKNQRSLGIIHMDPKGVLHFADGRWMKAYLVEDGIACLPQLMEKMHGSVTLTIKLGECTEKMLLSVFEESSHYEMAREAFSEDEAVLMEKIKIKQLSIEEMANEIRSLTDEEHEPFCFDDFMHKRKDFLSEIIPQSKPHPLGFYMLGALGSCHDVLDYWAENPQPIIGKCRGGQATLVLSVSLRNVNDEERKEYLKYLGERYQIAYEQEEIPRFLNSMASFMTFKWNDEANPGDLDILRKIHDAGYVVGLPCAEKQENYRRSILSCGIDKYGKFTNVPVDTVVSVFKRENSHVTDKV